MFNEIFAFISLLKSAPQLEANPPIANQELQVSVQESRSKLLAFGELQEVTKGTIYPYTSGIFCRDYWSKQSKKEGIPYRGSYLDNSTNLEQETITCKVTPLTKDKGGFVIPDSSKNPELVIHKFNEVCEELYNPFVGYPLSTRKYAMRNDGTKCIAFQKPGFVDPSR